MSSDAPTTSGADTNYPSPPTVGNPPHSVKMDYYDQDGKQQQALGIQHANAVIFKNIEAIKVDKPKNGQAKSIGIRATPEDTNADDEVKVDAQDSTWTTEDGQKLLTFLCNPEKWTFYQENKSMAMHLGAAHLGGKKSMKSMRDWFDHAYKNTGNKPNVTKVIDFNPTNLNQQTVHTKCPKATSDDSADDAVDDEGRPTKSTINTDDPHAKCHHHTNYTSSEDAFERKLAVAQDQIAVTQGIEASIGKLVGFYWDSTRASDARAHVDAESGTARADHAEARADCAEACVEAEAQRAEAAAESAAKCTALDAELAMSDQILKKHEQALKMLQSPLSEHVQYISPNGPPFSH
ncbi:hypothetical protein BS47DRAFT_1392053 [Hydnum rufescens UP504]|uniref:Uncharacterized protein n=1 Tax=Hydnum rufescens UP504 TaxID=1448309 RepID=A0A9P6AZN4_9AGAM|nr:hypothetical protein BS47DRAFT_1392053 [Hydnum rufescens UP504]